MKDAVIVSTARTPIGKAFRGAFNDTEAPVLGGHVIRAALDKVKVQGEDVGDVILGIANTEISDVKQFEAAVAKADKSKPVNVLFRRGEWTQYVLIRPLK